MAILYLATPSRLNWIKYFTRAEHKPNWILKSLAFKVTDTYLSVSQSYPST